MDYHHPSVESQYDSWHTLNYAKSEGRIYKRILADSIVAACLDGRFTSDPLALRGKSIVDMGTGT
jgi:hypothetical protein